ncbi:MAG TPA: hypothetical protein VNZ57_15910 [Longimicrobiales bacterium]|nr:hypothetical protein [Longimicrobiales bacterium]
MRTEVLAAVVLDSLPMRNAPPMYPIPGTGRETVRVVSDPTGWTALPIYELHLVRNDD